MWTGISALTAGEDQELAAPQAFTDTTSTDCRHWDCISKLDVGLSLPGIAQELTFQGAFQCISEGSCMLGCDSMRKTSCAHVGITMRCWL